MNKCTYCGTKDDVVYCRPHRRYMCDSKECAGLHRTSVRPELCACFAPSKIEWMDLLLALAGIGVAATAIAIAYVHMAAL